MTDQTLTHVYFLLDRSGSMQSIKSDIEGGFAAFIEEQRKASGRCRVTLAQFDDHYEVVYVDRDVAVVPALNLQPRGRTALLDAIGKLVTDSGARLADVSEPERPGTVIVAIMTDGLENASTEWGHPAIKALVEQQTRDYDWQFLYMGADQDAVEVGRSIGIAADHSMTFGRGMTADALALKSQKIAAMREARQTDAGAAMPGFTPEERRRVAE